MSSKPSLDSNLGAPHRLALLRRAVEGDDDALAVLLAESRGELAQRVALRIRSDLQRAMSAEDIIQEAHIEVFRRIRSFDVRGMDRFDRWVATIALRRLRNAIAYERRRKRGGDFVRAEDQRRQEDSTIALLETLVGPANTASRSVARREGVAAVKRSACRPPRTIPAGGSAGTH